ncbi:MAG: hypothetical protein ABTD50_22805 [Polyangiaceae bacterium]
MPLAPRAPFMPLPAFSATRTRFTDDATTSAARLDSPGNVASGDAKETSSIATPPDETPDTESA